jgi:hypothetical protein
MESLLHRSYSVVLASALIMLSSSRKTMASFTLRLLKMRLSRTFRSTERKSWRMKKLEL